MIPVGTAVGYLTLDYSQFSSNLKTAIGEATSLSGKFSDTLGKGLTTVGNQIAGVGKTMTTGLTVPIGVATASAVKFGAEFDKGMSNVAAVSGATTEEFDKMSDDKKFAYYQMGIVNSVTLDILVDHIMGNDFIWGDIGNFWNLNRSMLERVQYRYPNVNKPNIIQRIYNALKKEFSKTDNDF